MSKMLGLVLSVAWAICFPFSPALSADKCTKADVVVFGGTPSGIAAAIQASRLGKRVILLEPTEHVGGMMANGLTKTDVSPHRVVVGGIVREFFRKARDKYSIDLSTVKVYFESGWAEQTLQDMAEGAGVEILFRQHVVKVFKTDGRITKLLSNFNRIYCASVYVDASYEGDLMAMAGASFYLGREGVADYNEPLAGAQPLSWPTIGTDTHLLIDAYVEPGKPESGLLWGVEPYERRKLGEADTEIMAYNYRMCLTKDANNRVPFTKPQNYDVRLYEGLARYISAGKKAGVALANIYFTGNDLTVNGKYDKNSNRWFSTDYWGIGYDYISASEDGREAIRQKVRDYTLGYFWFGVSDPRVPLRVRNYTAQFGLCKDEFTDNGNVPRQIYVREGRRLIGDFVLTQNHLNASQTYTDAIGLGYYAMDEHGMRRTVIDGVIKDEVRKSVPTGVYQIPYRVLLPKPTEVTNLLVSGGISASHVAFTSVRVEPTLMVLGQAAGAAAALAPDGVVAKVDVNKLRSTLAAAGQIMAYDR